jgi:hypothetical protein
MERVDHHPEVKSTLVHIVVLVITLSLLDACVILMLVA